MSEGKSEKEKEREKGRGNPDKKSIETIKKRKEESKMPEEIKDELGTATISDEVVGAISGLAAAEVRGVAGMSEGIVGGIAKILSRSQIGKGVRVEVGKKEAAIDLAIIADYGSIIPEVIRNIQANIKNKVETMTGLKVIEVNVRVDGVKMPEEEKAPPPTRRVE